MQSYPSFHYEYLEERTLSNSPSLRQRKVKAVIDPKGSPHNLKEWRASHYFPWYHNILEGPEHQIDGDVIEAAWAMTATRISRYVGDPGSIKIPDRPEQIRARLESGEKPPAPDSLGPRTRTHHYYRIISSEELVKACNATGTNISIEVTEEWHNPNEGIVSPISPNSLVLGTHCIAILAYEIGQHLFVFPNSWGEEWGARGWGAISPSDIDRFLVEGYGTGGLGQYPPIQAEYGKVILLWKATWGGKDVHGREIVDAATGERIAWCFLVRRGPFLDIDELFVWPTHRKQGYGTILANLANESAMQMNRELRALVGYVDAYPHDRDRLCKIMDRLGLSLHPSDLKSIAFFGFNRSYAVGLAEPRFPLKPTVPVHMLDPEAATRVYPVWYATNRKLNDPSNIEKGFSSERDTTVHYGKCEVAIPRSHRFGSVGSWFITRWRRLNDDRLRIVGKQQLDTTAFWEELSQTLLNWDEGERQGLIFLHGYNTSFEEAAIRAAQIGYDLRFPGETAFFSWPSRGTYDGYPADEASIEASEHFIEQFLIDFATNSKIEKVHLIAHSMGNRGLARALHSIAATTEKSGVKLGQIVLAAPDIDCDVFRDLANVYQHVCERTTLYISKMDRAVAASKWLHEYPRVGLSPPITVVPGIDTIEVPKFNVFDLLGHGYFAEADGLLHDIYDLVRHNCIPRDRQRLIQAITPDGNEYWKMEN